MAGRDFRYILEKYTESGARTEFEHICYSLICKLYPHEDVHRIRPNPGDYGIDVFFGDFQNCINNFQCKFFLGSLTASRRAQIKKSFQTFMDEHQGTLVIHWTLCLPDTLTHEDIVWWMKWKRSNEERYHVQIELFDGDFMLNKLREVDLYDSFFDIANENGFESIIKSVPPIVPSNNPFHYSCPTMSGIYGRGEELRSLESFLSAHNSFSFWGITGTAGVGKSKIVYYLSRMKSLNWRFVFVPKNTVKALSQLRRYDIRQNTCLIVDYANEASEELSVLFQNLSMYENDRDVKLRILLIAREGMKEAHYYENEYPNWFQKILKSSPSIINRMYAQDFLALSGIEENAYRKLIDAYCSAFANVSLSDNDKKLISSYISNELADTFCKVEPLYVLFTVDAFVREKKVSHWDKKQLLTIVLQRNHEKWEKGIPNGDLLFALMEMLRYATIVGEWDPNIDAPRHLQKTASTVCRFIEQDMSNAIIGYYTTLTGRYIYRDRHYILPSLSPDIVGEYYVLDYLNKLTPLSKHGWISFFVEQFVACKDFFLRSIQNFGDDQFYGHTIVYIFSQILDHIEQEGKQAEALFEMITSLLGYYYSNYKGSSDPTIYNELIRLIDNYAALYQERYQCWAELKIAFRFRNTNYRLYHWRLNHFAVVRSLHERWPESALIAKEYISYLGNLIEDSAGKASQIDDQTEGFLALFDAFIYTHKEYRDESVIRNTLLACIHVISVINQIEAAKHLSTKYSQRIQEIIADTKFQIELMICYIENIDTLLLQLAKANNKAEIQTTIRNLKEYVKGCIASVAYRCFWITLPSITQSIVNLCAYKYTEEAIALSKYFFELINLSEYQQLRDYAVFHHEESSINRIFKSVFTPESVREIFINGSQPFVFL